MISIEMPDDARAALSSSFGFDVCPPGDQEVINKWRDERWNIKAWNKAGQPNLIVAYILVPMIYTANKYNIICARDFGHGTDWLFDGKEWYTARGVFTDKWVLLGAAQGYPEGALFQRVNL